MSARRPRAQLIRILKVLGRVYENPQERHVLAVQAVLAYAFEDAAIKVAYEAAVKGAE